MQAQALVLSQPLPSTEEKSTMINSVALSTSSNKMGHSHSRMKKKRTIMMSYC